jgi:hypothetical protein
MSTTFHLRVVYNNTLLLVHSVIHQIMKLYIYIYIYIYKEAKNEKKQHLQCLQTSHHT